MFTPNNGYNDRFQDYLNRGEYQNINTILTPVKKESKELNRQIAVIGPTVGVQIDKNELIMRQTTKNCVGGGYPQNKEIRSYELVYTRSDSTESPPKVMHLCNGLSTKEYSTPLQFMEAHTVLGCVQHEYSGDTRDIAMTIYTMASLQFEINTKVYCNEPLSWIPDVDISKDGKHYILDSWVIFLY